MAFESIKGLMRKQDVLLMGVCVLFAALFFVLAATNAANAGNFFTIDSLFFTLVCILLALTFLAIPAMSLHERGVLKEAFGVPEGVPPARAHDGEIHFEGSTKLFLYVLAALLGMTLIEVFFAYIHLDLRLMLTLLLGLSIVKAALIIAYFMHLKFERLSLVLTLVPALVVCICLLFIFFPDSFRSRQLRATPTTSTTHAASEAPH
jgi:cytochrome c oxidase subunit 4